MFFFKCWVLISSTIFLCVFTSCEQDISKNTEKPDAPRRTLYVTSIPSGATIFLNGRNMGQTTPDSLTWIEKDTNKVTLRLQYFFDSVFTIAAPAGQKTDIAIDYTQNPRMRGQLFLNSFPDSADVFINDSATGLHTPVFMDNLLPGLYQLTLKHYSCRDTKLPAIVQSSKTSYLYPGLEDTTYWVTYLPENSGIPHTFFNTVLADKNGIKWLGGVESGLTRYDEKIWQNYNTSNSMIPANHVLCLEEDNQNNLWIGTENGLAKFDGQEFTVYRQSNSLLPSNRITVLRLGTGGTIYAGTDKGLAKYSNGQWTAYNYGPLNNEWITDIRFAANGLMLFSTRNEIVLERDSGWVRFPYFPVPYVSTFCLLSNGKAWVGLSDAKGLMYCGENLMNPPSKPDRQNIRVSSVKAFAKEDITSIIQTSGGNVWVTTNKGVGRIITPTNIIRYNVANQNLRSIFARQVVKDANNYIWIATYGGGLTKFKGP